MAEDGRIEPPAGATKKRYLGPLPEVTPDEGLIKLIADQLVRGELSISEFIEQMDWSLAAAHNLSVSDFRSQRESDRYVAELAKNDLRCELLRFFADRIDAIADAIEKLDETNFEKLIPAFLAAPFRELHVNCAIGNYGTAIVVCGALLEMSLKDLLPTDKTLQDAIEEAKSCGLLMNHAIRHAYQVKNLRNDILHGKTPFGEITSEQAWDVVTKTRLLVRALYHARLEEAHDGSPD